MRINEAGPLHKGKVKKKTESAIMAKRIHYEGTRNAQCTKINRGSTTDEGGEQCDARGELEYAEYYYRLCFRLQAQARSSDRQHGLKRGP